jgi:hypothetical protein
VARLQASSFNYYAARAGFLVDVWRLSPPNEGPIPSRSMRALVLPSYQPTGLQNRWSAMPARKRPEKTEPTLPERDVRELLDPEQTEADFLLDLERVTTNRAKEKQSDRDE